MERAKRLKGAGGSSRRGISRGNHVAMGKVPWGTETTSVSRGWGLPFRRGGTQMSWKDGVVGGAVAEKDLVCQARKLALKHCFSYELINRSQVSYTRKAISFLNLHYSKRPL